MAVPNYTYLKLKISGPNGTITAGPTYQRAYECDAECFQFAEATIWSEKLHADPRSDQDVPESSKRAACSFEPPKDIKDVVVSDDGCTLRIGTTLDPK
jgi:hypothetical protein